MHWNSSFAELTQEACTGSRVAAEEVLLLVSPRVRNVVGYLVRSDTDVDDIVQDVLSTVFCKLGTYKGKGDFVAWVDRIAARCTFAHRRRVVRRREAALPETDVTRSDWGAEAEYAVRRELVERLDALPRHQRDALVMHHVLCMSVPEIAYELSVPEGTVRSRLRLGRARMRACLERRAGGWI